MPKNITPEQNPNQPSESTSWVGKKVALKSDSPLYDLIPFPVGSVSFTVTDDNDIDVKIAGYPSIWIDKKEFSLV